MKIAYFTPLNPEKSGISDFSEELIPYLSTVMEIDIFTNNKAQVDSRLKTYGDIYNVEEYDDEKIRNKYDIAVFHVGNNFTCHHKIVEIYKKYGGVLELHDISLHHYLAEETIVNGRFDEYKAILTYCHGVKGEKIADDFIAGRIASPWESMSMELTVNKHLVDRAKAVIVHSDYAKQMLKGIGVTVPIKLIPLHTVDIAEDYLSLKIKGKHSLGIDEDCLVLGSFGLATKEKRVLEILSALKICKNKGLYFHYYIVGKVAGLDIEKAIKEYDLSDYVTITGFVTLEKFKEYMEACDICLNLRFPTQGESSASLHRMLGLGKPIILTDIGSFQEYSGDFTYKISYGSEEINDICKAIFELSNNKTLLEKKSAAAVLFAKKYCSVEKNAEKYKTFLQDVLENNFHEDYLESIVDKIWNLNS